MVEFLTICQCNLEIGGWTEKIRFNERRDLGSEEQHCWSFLVVDSWVVAWCSFEFDQHIVCIWDEGTGSNMIKQWFIGFYLDENQDSQNKLYCIDHWERMEGSKNYLCWTMPKLSDIQIVKEDQILPENVNGSWYLSGKNQWFQ